MTATGPDPFAPIDAALAGSDLPRALALAAALLADPEQHRAALSKIIGIHLGKGDPQAAWPFADRLRRLRPTCATDLLVAGVVAHRCGDRATAGALLREALQLDPSDPMAARMLHHLLPEHRRDLPSLEALLANAAIDAECRVALRLSCASAPGPFGVAFVTDGRIAGSVAGTAPVLARLRWEGREIAAAWTRPSEEGCCDFELPIPAALRGRAPLTVEVDGTGELIGSPVAAALTATPEFESSVEQDAEFLHLRAWQPALPDRPLALSISFGSGRQTRHILRRNPATKANELAELPPLTVPLADAAELRVTFEATGEPFAVQPLVPARPAPALHQPPALPVDIVVPVYGDFAATVACLGSLLASPPGCAAEIVVIDDETPDPRIAGLLDELAAAGRITLLRNPANLGFVRSVNRGMALHAERDVVLLNADTLVAGDWLARLKRAAYSAPAIATATPWSNDATILSYPDADAPVALATIDVGVQQARAARVLGDAVIDIPTAVGFCMYIKRRCLDQIGWLDHTLFGHGYGEENEFCCRATAAGWRHVAALGSYVGHIGGASFGSSKEIRIRGALAKLATRFPDYETRIDSFLADNPLRPARRALDLARLAEQGPRPVLIICPKLGGGTERFVKEQIALVEASGRAPILLRAESKKGRSLVRLEVPGSSDFPNLVYEPEEGGALLRDLASLEVRQTVLHHLMDLDRALAQALMRAWPYQIHIHDYSWICPRINLVDGTGRYCGEPAAAVCDRCVAAHGAEIAHDVPVADWRTFTRELLEGAGAVLCPSSDTATRIARYVPASSLLVVPHPEPPVVPGPLPPALPGRRRIAVIGAINEVKGYEVLRACAEDAARRDLALDFILIGHSEDDPTLFATGRIFITGQYEDGEAVQLARLYGCQVAFLPSVWPETWCYVLTEAWRAGLPVVAFDLGAQAERMRAAGIGLLVGLATTPGQLNDILLTC